MNTEIKLDEYAFLVSESSHEGIIRFASDDFCKLSEYSLDELSGQSLKVIYHDDMPKKILDELWSTIGRGETWVGYVKNSTKNGNYFWTFTNIYPFTSSNGESGYLSCRKKASDREIEQYTLIYQQINEELEGPIHAISLHTFTDSEWKDKNETAQDSPDCLGGMKKEDS